MRREGEKGGREGGREEGRKEGRKEGRMKCCSSRGRWEGRIQRRRNISKVSIF